MKKILNIVLLVLWMLFIFTMSNFKAEDSSNQSGFIVNILVNIFNIKNVELVTTIIRKCAHILEYIILGILMLNALKDYSVKNIVLTSILICIMYSCLDEIHQIFIEGRSGEILDVFIDSLGIVIGNLIYKKIKLFNNH